MEDLSRHLSKGDTRAWEKMLMSLIIREMQIKILIPHTCQNACHQKDNKSWRGCRERGTSCFVGGNANWYNHYDKLWRFCKKFKKEVPHSLAISPLDIYLKKTKVKKKYAPPNVVVLLFSHSVMPTSLRPHGLQHSRLPWPSPTPRACSNSCPLGQ